MKGIGCLIVLLLTPVVFVAWQLVTMVCPYLFLLLAVLVFRHHWPSAVSIAIPAGFAIYVLFLPIGLVSFVNVTFDGVLAVTLAALATVRYLGRQFNETELARPKIFLFANAMFFATLLLLGFMICTLLLLQVVSML